MCDWWIRIQWITSLKLVTEYLVKDSGGAGAAQSPGSVEIPGGVHIRGKQSTYTVTGRWCDEKKTAQWGKTELCWWVQSSILDRLGEFLPALSLGCRYDLHQSEGQAVASLWPDRRNTGQTHTLILVQAFFSLMCFCSERPDFSQSDITNPRRRRSVVNVFCLSSPPPLPLSSPLSLSFPFPLLSCLFFSSVAPRRGRGETRFHMKKKQNH